MAISNDSFQLNIEKIDSLSISFYEKDVIRSAYYNHLNNIPISKIAIHILKKHNITFKNGNVVTKITEIENRKKSYKRRYESSVYSKDLLSQMTTNRRNILYKYLDEANQHAIDTEKFLNDSKEMLNICFRKTERSYIMILDSINNIDKTLQNNINTLNNYVKPFLESFDNMQPYDQKDIINKSSEFLNNIKEAKDISVSLCVKISKIKANNETSDDDNMLKYLQSTIDKLDKYTKHKTN